MFSIAKVGLIPAQRIVAMSALQVLGASSQIASRRFLTKKQQKPVDPKTQSAKIRNLLKSEKQSLKRLELEHKALVKSHGKLTKTRIEAAKKEALKPYRPISSYVFYVKERVGGEVKNLTEAAKAFKQLSSDELDKYEQKAKQFNEAMAQRLPPKPTKPLFPFARYLADFFKTSDPEEPFSSRVKAAADQWKKMSQSEKDQKYPPTNYNKEAYTQKLDAWKNLRWEQVRSGELENYRQELFKKLRG